MHMNAQKYLWGHCIFLHICAYFVHIYAYFNLHIMAYSPLRIFQHILCIFKHIKHRRMHILNMHILKMHIWKCIFMHIWFCVFVYILYTFMHMVFLHVRAYFVLHIFELIIHMYCIFLFLHLCAYSCIFGTSFWHMGILSWYCCIFRAYFCIYKSAYNGIFKSAYNGKFTLMHIFASKANQFNKYSNFKLRRAFDASTASFASCLFFFFFASIVLLRLWTSQK